MDKFERKKTLMWVFDIALMADIISQCRTMPFKQKYDIVKLGDYCKALIEHMAGEELTPLLEEENREREKIQTEFDAEIAKFIEGNPEFKEESYRKTQQPKLLKMVNENKRLKELEGERLKIMKQDCADKIPEVKIPAMQYEEKISDEKKVASYMGGMLSMDGMEALMGLISRGAVVLEEGSEKE